MTIGILPLAASIAIAVAALSVGQSAFAQTESGQAPPAGCEGEPLLTYPFDSAESIGLVPNSTQEVIDGRLQLTSILGTEVGVNFPLERELSNEICVSVAFLGGSDPARSSAALGLYNDQGSVQLNIFPDGHANIRRYTGGLWTVIVPDRKFSAIRTGVGAVNQLKVVVIHNDATWYINGEPFESLVGPMTPWGPSVAVLANSPLEGSAVFTFDDLVVTQSPLARVPGPDVRAYLAGIAAGEDAQNAGRCEGPATLEDRFVTIERNWLDLNEPDPTISHGRLWLSADAGKGTLVSRELPPFKDFDACVRVTHVDGPNFGLVSMRLGLWDGKAGRGVWFDLNSDGTVSAQSDANNVETALLEPIAVTSVRKGRGAANDLKLSMRDGQLSLIVNGESIGTVPGLRADYLMLAVRSPAAGVATASFSDLKVTRHESAALASCGGEVVFEDRFDSLDPAWRPAENLQVDSGQLQMPVSTRSVATRAVEGHDLRVCASTMLLSLGGEGREFVRSQLMVSDSTRAALGVRVGADGSIRIVDERGEYVAAPAPATGREGQNDLRIEIAGTRVLFFVNDVRVAAVDRELAMPLSVGLEVTSNTGWVSTWAFDNVKVTKLDEQSVLQAQSVPPQATLGRSALPVQKETEAPATEGSDAEAADTVGGGVKGGN